MGEYIIENITDEELNKLENSDIEWIIDDLKSSDICIYGTHKDALNALKIIGRIK